MLVYTNYKSFIPETYKVDLIKSLLFIVIIYLFIIIYLLFILLFQFLLWFYQNSSKRLENVQRMFTVIKSNSKYSAKKKLGNSPTK